MVNRYFVFCKILLGIIQKHNIFFETRLETSFLKTSDKILQGCGNSIALLTVMCILKGCTKSPTRESFTESLKMSWQFSIFYTSVRGKLESLKFGNHLKISFRGFNWIIPRSWKKHNFVCFQVGGNKKKKKKKKKKKAAANRRRKK